MFYDIISKEFMGVNIPIAIKVDVIREWLRCKSRDQIAKQEGIGSGTVSSIIKECRQQNDTEFDLMRQVAFSQNKRNNKKRIIILLIIIRQNDNNNGYYSA